MKTHSFNPAVFELACLRMRDRAEREGITPEQAFGYLLNSCDIEKAGIPVSDEDIEYQSEEYDLGFNEVASNSADRIANIFEMHSFVIAQQIKLGANCEL